MRMKPLPVRLNAVIYRYKNDLAFRGRVSLYQGMTMNLLYAVFRLMTGVRYDSVWFISMSVYYFALGLMKAYLAVCRRLSEKRGLEFEERFPMGIMITLMIVDNRGFSYPGYVIYLSAVYTFWSAANSVVNLVRFRKLGSPILSASKALNFVAAMMSVLGLQTAMIAAFSSDSEEWRRMMNTITGGFVYAGVIATAVFMLIRSKRKQVKQ